jgi:hypothetical protein
MKCAALILLLYFSTGLSAQQLECSNYHFGKFKFIETKSNTNIRIERIGDKQIETDLTNGKTSSFKVNWINDCEYELTITEGSSEYVNFYRNKILIIRIIEKYIDGYRFEGHIKGSREYKTHFMRFL